MELRIGLLALILPFKAKFVSQFSPELQARIFKCGTYICRMSDCIVGLRLRVVALFFYFYPFFFFPFMTC